MLGPLNVMVHIIMVHIISNCWATPLHKDRPREEQREEKGWVGRWLSDGSRIGGSCHVSHFNALNLLWNKSSFEFMRFSLRGYHTTIPLRIETHRHN